MVYRIYVAKKSAFALEADALKAEIKNLLGIDGVDELKVINRYDVEDIEKVDRIAINNYIRLLRDRNLAPTSIIRKIASSITRYFNSFANLIVFFNQNNIVIWM